MEAACGGGASSMRSGSPGAPLPAEAQELLGQLQGCMDRGELQAAAQLVLDAAPPSALWLPAPGPDATGGGASGSHPTLVRDGLLRHPAWQVTRTQTRWQPQALGSAPAQFIPVQPAQLRTQAHTL